MADDDDTMEEGAENEGVLDGEDAYDEEGEGGSKNLLLIIGGILVLLIGAAAGLYFTGMLDSVLGKSGDVQHAEDGDHAEDAGGHGGGHGEEGVAANFLEIPTILVNLSSDDGTPRYLRLTVQLELYSAEDRAAVEAVIPRVIDQFQTYLRELRVKDLRGSAGIYRLQMELLWRVNQAASPTKVKDVLFQEILIQ